MQVLATIDDPRLALSLNSGGIAVIRTDTLYGIVARADIQSAVEKVYAVKNRDLKKSCIILLDSAESGYGDSVRLLKYKDIAGKNPTSILMKAPDAPKWLLRQNDELAFRIPSSDKLRRLIKSTAPLIAPSANPEGLEPAHTIDQAIEYFGDQVDVYVDGGEVPLDISASNLIRIMDDGTMEKLR